MMGGKHKGGINVLWMPRKKKHHHHNNYKQNNKSYQTRPKSNHNMTGHSSHGAPGFFGESHSDHLIKKSDVIPLDIKKPDGVIDNPSTSTVPKTDGENQEETKGDENVENVEENKTSNDDDYLEKTDSPDGDEKQKDTLQKKDEDTDDEEKEESNDSSFM